MLEQILISSIIVATLIFFIKGKWRYDVIAMIALFTATIFGLIPLDEIFLGFVHPVVVLVVSMLIISSALVSSGVIDFISRYFKFIGNHFIIQLGILMILVVFLSAFINSMGALAFMIPIAIRMAKKSGVSLSLFLLPLAFGSHLGGGVTLIGSVSNIIVSGFRAQETTSPFGFFDFAYVAIPIAITSIIFITLIGWRLLPKRNDIFSQSACLDKYITEIKILPDSPVVGKDIAEFQKFAKEEFNLLALARGGGYFSLPRSSFKLKEGDILVIEAETMVIEAMTTTLKLELVYKRPFDEDEKHTKGFEVTEVVVPDSSFLLDETAKGLEFHHRFRVNLLGIHRTGMKLKKRLKDIAIKAGDVLIIQGEEEHINQFTKAFGLLPLKEKSFNFEGKKETAMLTGGLFVLAIIISAFNFIDTHVVFAVAAIIMIALGIVSPKKLNTSVDFSMIVLIAVMIQLGSIFYETGAASSLAGLLFLFNDISPELALAVILLSSIWLSDVMSNVTVAVLLAPVAFSVALQLGVSPDPFLMAVAIGSGSSYLTPIGHQSNIFVMGIGGYKFSDYWRLGLPLEIITFVLGMIFITRYWAF